MSSLWWAILILGIIFRILTFGTILFIGTFFTNSFQLEISKPTEFFPTRYSDNGQDSNSVLDFVFFQPNLTKQNNHHIHPDWRLTSDYAPISVNISIVEKHIQTTKQVLAKNSEEKDYFIKELINFIKNLKTDSILDSNIVVATTRHKVQ